MSKKPKKPIPMNPSDHNTLANLYLARRIGTDRYMHRRNDLNEITAAFNGLTAREELPGDILHYMQTKRRKKGQWPTFDGNHLRVPVVIGHLVDPKHLDVLIEIYVSEFSCGPEKIAQERVLCIKLERCFEELSGVRKRGYILATALIELRKDGRLPKHGRNRPDDFNDFNEAEELTG